MLNVTIQNDGKIKLQSECSGLKELKFNVNLLLGVVQSMEIEEAAANKEPISTNQKILVDQDRKLLAVKDLKENLDLWLRDAKGYIDSYCAGKKPVLLTGYEDEVTKVTKSSNLLNV